MERCRQFSWGISPPTVGQAVALRAQAKPKIPNMNFTMASKELATTDYPDSIPRSNIFSTASTAWCRTFGWKWAGIQLLTTGLQSPFSIKSWEKTSAASPSSTSQTTPKPGPHRWNTSWQIFNGLCTWPNYATSQTNNKTWTWRPIATTSTSTDYENFAN